MEPYSHWIEAYVAREKHVLGQCMKASEEMQKVFPELELVRGHVYVPGWGKRGHVWLQTKEGAIVDPTASQFPEILEYEPWRPGDEVLVGKCMECGDEIWAEVNDLGEPGHARSFCDTNCESAFTASFEMNW